MVGFGVWRGGRCFCKRLVGGHAVRLELAKNFLHNDHGGTYKAMDLVEDGD
jgi:hypothetical protein